MPTTEESVSINRKLIYGAFALIIVVLIIAIIGLFTPSNKATFVPKKVHYVDLDPETLISLPGPNYHYLPGAIDNPFRKRNDDAFREGMLPYPKAGVIPEKIRLDWTGGFHLPETAHRRKLYAQDPIAEILAE